MTLVRIGGIVFLCALALTLATCATIVNGGSDTVTIRTAPWDAAITVDGRAMGTGTARCSLKRGEQHTIEVQKAGYRSAIIKTGKRLSGWYWANLTGYFFLEGMIVDLATGSAYNVDPNPIDIALSQGSGEPIVQTGDQSAADGLAALPFIAFGILMVWLTVEIIRGYS